MANLIQIEKYLRRQKLPYRLISLSSNKVIDLAQEAFTVSDVVDAGKKLDEVVKTLIVRTNGDFVVLVLRGNDRVDFKKVRRLFGSKSELAKSEEVLKVVGVPIGAVCPILVGMPVYIDGNVMNLRNVHMGSGDLKHGLEMKLEDFLKAIGGYQIKELSN